MPELFTYVSTGHFSDWRFVTRAVFGVAAAENAALFDRTLNMPKAKKRVYSSGTFI